MSTETHSPGFVTVDAHLIDELQTLVGYEQVITAEAEVETLSKDCYWYSPVLKSGLMTRRASAFVKVSSVAELKAVMALAYRNDLPLTIRGGATGNYGQSIPLCGGLVVDITGLDQILTIEDGVVTTEPGVRVINLERAVRLKGYELRCLPSTWVKSTVSGFISGGSGGIGSITWGGLRELGTIKRLKILTLEAEPREIVLEEADALKAFHAYGTNGVITELQLRLAPAKKWDQIIVTGPDWSTVAGFATRIAYDNAIPKRLLSLLEASFGASFKPLRKWLPDGHAFILMEVEQATTGGIVAEAKAKGLEVTQVIPHKDPKGQPMIMEYGWNHSTLWMLKAHPGHTFLQLGMGEDFLEKSAKIKSAFPGQIHLHYEFVRGRAPNGEFGRVIPVLLPVVQFVSAEHLKKVIAFIEGLGIGSNNPHSCYLEDAAREPLFEAQLALKREADPKGLLNPGKMRTAASPGLIATLPKFLYN